MTETLSRCSYVVRGSARLETARNQAELMRTCAVPAATDLAPAFVLSQAAGLRRARPPCGGAAAPPASDEGVVEQHPQGTMLARRVKNADCGRITARASSGHHDMGASVAPVPTVRTPAGPGVTKDDHFSYILVIFPGPTRPATLSTAGRRRCRLLHK